MTAPVILAAARSPFGARHGALAGIAPADLLAEVLSGLLARCDVDPTDLDEVLGLSHRVMVLSRGRQRGILDRSEADHVSVMERAIT